MRYADAFGIRSFCRKPLWLTTPSPNHNSLTNRKATFTARATPQTVFGKIIHPEGCRPICIFGRIDRGVARASKIKSQNYQLQVIGAGVVATSIRSKNCVCEASAYKIGRSKYLNGPTLMPEEPYLSSSPTPEATRNPTSLGSSLSDILASRAIFPITIPTFSSYSKQTAFL